MKSILCGKLMKNNVLTIFISFSIENPSLIFLLFRRFSIFKMYFRFPWHLWDCDKATQKTYERKTLLWKPRNEKIITCLKSESSGLESAGFFWGKKKPADQSWFGDQDIARCSSGLLDNVWRWILSASPHCRPSAEVVGLLVWYFSVLRQCSFYYDNVYICSKSFQTWGFDL